VITLWFVVALWLQYTVIVVAVVMVSLWLVVALWLLACDCFVVCEVWLLCGCGCSVVTALWLLCDQADTPILISPTPYPTNHPPIHPLNLSISTSWLQVVMVDSGCCFLWFLVDCGYWLTVVLVTLWFTTVVTMVVVAAWLWLQNSVLSLLPRKVTVVNNCGCGCG